MHNSSWCGVTTFGQRCRRCRKTFDFVTYCRRNKQTQPYSLLLKPKRLSLKTTGTSLPALLPEKEMKLWIVDANHLFVLKPRRNQWGQLKDRLASRRSSRCPLEERSFVTECGGILTYSRINLRVSRSTRSGPPMGAWSFRTGCLWVWCRSASRQARCDRASGPSSSRPCRRFARLATQCRLCRLRTFRESVRIKFENQNLTLFKVFLQTHPSLMQCFLDLMHIDGSLGDFELAPFACQVEDRVASDAGQDESIQWRSDQLTFCNRNNLKLT